MLTPHELSEERIPARIAELMSVWGLPAKVDGISVRFSARMSRSVGRADHAHGRITLADWLRDEPVSLEVALCHELAHLVAFRLVGGSERKHGPTWQRLMLEAGHEPVIRLPAVTAPNRKTRSVAVRRYAHSCPICEFVRTAARPIRGWRCADCVAAGLDGHLEIKAVRRVA